MKIQAKTHILIPSLLFLLLTVSACSEFTQIIGDGTPQDQGTSITISGLTGQLQPDGMLAFEGSVFVASTKPSRELWNLAGWQISKQPLTSEDDPVPANCTLYPHHGVDDQWIGSCSGNTFIPENGASHIAVMHTQPDGTTTLVQVAPPPAMDNP